MPGIDVEVRAAVSAIERAPGVPVLNGAGIHVAAGSSHGIVGGSASGKTTLVRAILGREALRSGSVRVGGFRLPLATAEARRTFARVVGFVPQDAPGSLDPSMPVGRAVVEGLRVHGLVRPRDLRGAAIDLLRRVGMDEPAMDRLPGELSGGQCQRVCIARAIATGPTLLVADEPTSALDPLLQARVLDLIAALKAWSGATLLLVSHSLGVVRRVCDQVTVLDAGRVAETGPVARVLAEPSHPHTRRLVEAEPTIRPRT